MKRLMRVLVGIVALMLFTTGNVWADYGTGLYITVIDYSNGSFFYYRMENSIAKASDDPENGQLLMQEKVLDGNTGFAVNAVDNSRSSSSYKISFFQTKDCLNSYEHAFGEASAIAAGVNPTYIKQGAIYNAQNAKGEKTGLIKFQYVSDQQGERIVLSTSVDEGTTWIQQLTAPAMSYADFVQMYGQNSEAEVDSRQEKAKLSSRLTTQMVATRVMHVFSATPRNKSAAPKKISANLFQSGYTESGLSSGSDEDYGIGVWGMGAYAASDRTKSGSKSESNVGVFMLGIDKLLMDDKIAAGIGMSYENSWSKIKDSGSTYDGNGFAISPYLAYRITDSLTLRGVFNAAFNDYDADEGNDYDGTRLMGDVSGEYTWLLDNWLLALDMGYMYMNEDFNHSYEDVYLSEGRVGGKVGYSFSNGLLPYFKATYYQEFGSSSSSSDEDSSYEGAVGLDYRVNSWVVSLEAFDNFNDDRNTFGGSAMLRYEF